jgi:GNAT superfamily N-acetyltransferase
MCVPLDNPIWESLSHFHQPYNEGGNRLKYFIPDVSPFVAMQHWEEEDKNYLTAHLPADRNFFYIISDPILLPDTCEVVFTTPLYQMVCNKHVPYTVSAMEIRTLGKEDIPRMIELTALTKPGPFNQRTIEFGNYIGIFEGDRLAAMAGERLKLNNYTEISAICTHPDFLGKGYAASLLSVAASRIDQTGAVPFLHVRCDNERAISMYEKAGFEIRCKMNFAIFRKNNT